MVMPSSDHTTTSTSRAIVPKNLRVRIVMADMSGFLGILAGCTREGADYKGRANSIKRALARAKMGFMIAGSAQQAPHPGVRWWLIVVAALIALMVLVGGATRLTESGLSIVEWKPVTGTLPPLDEAA